MAKTGLIIETVIGLFLFLYVVGAIVPQALASVVNNTHAAAEWSASVVSLWGILGIFIVIAIVLMIYSFAKKEF